MRSRSLTGAHERLWRRKQSLRSCLEKSAIAGAGHLIFRAHFFRCFLSEFSPLNIEWSPEKDSARFCSPKPCTSCGVYTSVHLRLIQENDEEAAEQSCSRYPLPRLK